MQAHDKPPKITPSPSPSILAPPTHPSRLKSTNVCSPSPSLLHAIRKLIVQIKDIYNVWVSLFGHKIYSLSFSSSSSDRQSDRFVSISPAVKVLMQKAMRVRVRVRE